MRRLVRVMALLGGVILAAAGCAEEESEPIRTEPVHYELEVVAESEFLWTGVAVSGNGRIFVSYPRWGGPAPFSVAEVGVDGTASAYPDERWNGWDATLPPDQHFVAVQAVYIDRSGALWILDTGVDLQLGLIGGGAKLVRVDLATDTVVGAIHFGRDVAPPGSYLNDVRIDTERGFAYLTDSGLGALVVVDLGSGESRRLLADHRSTKSEGTVLTVEGIEWRRPDGKARDVHSDGIALDPSGEHIYFQALTGKSLYRIETQWLRDPSIDAGALAEKVELVAAPGPADGIAFGPDGVLHLTSIEMNAIRTVGDEGSLEIAVEDERLKWPDSFSVASDGTIYVTTSQIHLGAERTDPYRVFALRQSR